MLQSIKKILLITFLFCSVSPLYAQPLLRTEIHDAVNRKAVCNDGSPAIYYFRPGSGTGTKRWVIFLECAIGWCTGPYCDGTSLDYPQVYDAQDGILSSLECQNPDFYNANVGYIINCSRDIHSGNGVFVGGAGPIQFRGRNIFRSTIQDLIDKPGSTLNESGAEVLLVGPNCGGIATMIHLDWLAQKLPNAKVRGLNDNGWLFQSRTPGWIGYDYEVLRNDLETAIQIWKSELNEDCVFANPKQRSNCLLPPAYQLLKTPLFIQFSQWDYHFIDPDPSSSQTQKFSRDARRSLDAIPAAFSSQYSISAVAFRREFNSLKVNGFSLAELLGNWFFNRAGPVKAISTVPNTKERTCGGRRKDDSQ